jgi:hypothetical protein
VTALLLKNKVKAPREVEKTYCTVFETTHISNIEDSLNYGVPSPHDANPACISHSYHSPSILAPPSIPHTTPRYLSTTIHDFNIVESYRIVHANCSSVILLDPGYALPIFLRAPLVTRQSVSRTTTGTLALSSSITSHSCLIIVFI